MIPELIIFVSRGITVFPLYVFMRCTGGTVASGAMKDAEMELRRFCAVANVK